MWRMSSMAYQTTHKVEERTSKHNYMSVEIFLSLETET